MPSAHASSTGNANTQNTASGSRRNSRKRDEGQLDERMTGRIGRRQEHRRSRNQGASEDGTASAEGGLSRVLNGGPWATKTSSSVALCVVSRVNASASATDVEQRRQRHVQLRDDQRASACPARARRARRAGRASASHRGSGLPSASANSTTCSAPSEAISSTRRAERDHLARDRRRPRGRTGPPPRPCSAS